MVKASASSLLSTFSSLLLYFLDDGRNIGATSFAKAPAGKLDFAARRLRFASALTVNHDRRTNCLQRLNATAFSPQIQLGRHWNHRE
jgi:hypothetical protein